MYADITAELFYTCQLFIFIWHNVAGAPWLHQVPQVHLSIVLAFFYIRLFPIVFIIEISVITGMGNTVTVYDFT